MINRETAIALFERNSCLVRNSNVIPEDVAINLTCEGAVLFSKKMDSSNFNGFGIGNHTMCYLTEKGFLMAVTYMNVNEHGKRTIQKQ